MPSSFSTSLRFEEQLTGENTNTWGVKLSATLARVDDAIAGFVTKALTVSPYTLVSTNSNAAADEARSAMLKFTGTGAFTVTIPSVSKTYVVWNACTGLVTMTTGAGATVDVSVGEKVLLICDSSGVYRVKATNFEAARLTNVADPTSDQDAATKKYVDDTAFTANAGILPGQGGNAGKFLTTNATTASWAQIIDTDVRVRRRRLLYKEML